MKTLLKVLGIGFAVLVLVVGVAAATVFVRSNSILRQTHLVNVKPVPVPTDASSIARGRHVALPRGCLDCHGPDLGGAKVFENGAMGSVTGRRPRT